MKGDAHLLGVRGVLDDFYRHFPSCPAAVVHAPKRASSQQLPKLDAHDYQSNATFLQILFSVMLNQFI
jgi:hypothetical protein